MGRRLPGWLFCYQIELYFPACTFPSKFTTFAGFMFPPFPLSFPFIFPTDVENKLLKTSRSSSTVQNQGLQKSSTQCCYSNTFAGEILSRDAELSWQMAELA